MESTERQFAFLQGGGEMGQLTQNHPWEQTPLGASHQWPLSLRTLIQMMLTSRFPMLIFWGPELITFYNDAFRPSLGNEGKHPSSLGQRGEESWAESWPVIGPMIGNIMAGGEAVWFEDQKLPIYREGQMGYAYWTYSFSPLSDDTGAVNGVLVTCSETTQAVESRQQLEASEAFNRTLLTNSPVASLVFTGSDMVIRSINEAMLLMLGRDDSIIGQSFMQAMPELRETTLMDRLGQVLTTSQTYHQPEERLELIRYGQPYTGYYNYIYSALHEPDGEPSGVMVTAVEVTEQVLARQQLEQMQAELERLVEQRTGELRQANEDLHRSNDNLQQFAYIASHDLQEPLRKIQSFSSLLTQQLNGQLDESAEAYLQRITSAGARMSILIKDLLTYSRISTRQQAFGPVSLGAIVKDVLSTLDWEIQQRSAQISLDELPVIRGDKSQLGQLFQNLLTNAMKFVVPGQSPQIHIQYVHRSLSELPAQVQLSTSALFYHQISVSDQGVGFDTKFLDRIFQVFQRLHGKKEFPGTGVGLAICQRVVENHGGAITASSQPGQGATFYVYLPA